MNKFRAIGLFLLLTAVVCVVPGQTTSGQDQESWQKDWQKFGEAIVPYARAGVIERKADEREFNQIFSKDVEWTGTLRKFHFNGVAKFLDLEMQPIRIPLRDGGTIEVSELSIWCAVEANGCKGWSADLEGKVVIFRTKLMNRTRGVLPVVRLRGEGIEIETFGADLVRVIAK